MRGTQGEHPSSPSALTFDILGASSPHPRLSYREVLQALSGMLRPMAACDVSVQPSQVVIFKGVFMWLSTFGDF